MPWLRPIAARPAVAMFCALVCLLLAPSADAKGKKKGGRAQRDAPATAATDGPAPDPMASGWSCAGGVCVRGVARGEYVHFEVRSQDATVRWVAVEPQRLENMKPLQASPFVARVEPGATVAAGALGTRNPGQPRRYAFSWRSLAGDPNAVHDDAWLYRMPFGGGGMRLLSQGYDGRFSHKGTNALDFRMPWGTPILASRGGTIVEVANDNVAGGLKGDLLDKANRVVIEHRDGTRAIYGHLRHGGPARVGQRLEQGDLVGLSGDTGYSGGPHLHFHVYRARVDGGVETIPVRFWNGTAKGARPVEGLSYAASCHRENPAGCRPGELASEHPASTDRPRADARPAAPANASSETRTTRRLENGACQCANGAILHVDLPCGMVCGR